MESFLNRYRNITVLLLVIFAQLLLLAVQVKTDRDVPIIRVWTVTAVTPVARLLEGVRSGSVGFVRNYIMLRNADEENRRLRAELDKYKVENIFLKNELNTAERAKALQVLQAHTPSKTLAASVIGTGPGPSSKVVFVDRGSVAGVQRGMAVVTPDGIAGTIIAAYPTASEVLLVTDPDFAAGVVSQKNQARGTLKGQGTPLCKVDYVSNEDKLEVGEMFFTSGEDRIFPRGFPVGVVKSVRPGQPYKQISVEPAGLRHGLEDVLILIENVHQEIPDAPPANQPVYIAPPPPAPAQTTDGAGVPAPRSGPAMEADKLRDAYKATAEEQKHTFGDGIVHDTRPMDFTKLGQPATAPQGSGGAPAGSAGRGRGPGTAPTAAPPATANPGATNPVQRRANQAAGASDQQTSAGQPTPAPKKAPADATSKTVPPGTVNPSAPAPPSGAPPRK